MKALSWAHVHVIKYRSVFSYTLLASQNTFKIFKYIGLHRKILKCREKFLAQNPDIEMDAYQEIQAAVQSTRSLQYMPVCSGLCSHRCWLKQKTNKTKKMIVAVNFGPLCVSLSVLRLSLFFNLEFPLRQPFGNHLLTSWYPSRVCQHSIDLVYFYVYFFLR